jgi:hypothetical protein
MQDLVVGLLAIAVGLLFGLRGFIAMRVLISAWGAFAGFLLGAGLVDLATDHGFLRVAAGWLLGAALAVLFGLVAYLYYEVSVLVAMASIGFALGSSAMAALGVRWSWVVILIGVLVGVLLAVGAMVADLPAVILVVLTAFAGASATVFGLMLLTGVVDTSDFDSATITERLDDGWWWYALYLVLAAVGLVAQTRLAGRLMAPMSEHWRRPAGPAPGRPG